LEFKEFILEKSLKNVHEFGWTMESITNSVVEEGLSEMSHAMFPNGIYDLVEYFMMKTNRQAIEKLKIYIQENKLTSQQIVTQAIKIRLELNLEYKKDFHELMAIALLPENLTSSLYVLGVFVDEVCFLANQKDANVGISKNLTFFRLTGI
jgi:ubiquinone biosynthesis protein COQ9